MRFQRQPRKLIQERALQATAVEILGEARCAVAGAGRNSAPERADIRPRVEARLVSACWTLRRLPDRETGFLRMRGALWPETGSNASCYAGESLTTFAARRQVRLTVQEIDQMQPSLDLLLLLPEIEDRRLLFWACWHQEGEVSARIRWAKVRRSLAVTASRWTMKRQYDGALDWLSGLILLQAPSES